MEKGVYGSTFEQNAAIGQPKLLPKTCLLA
jgi:hypothetical protein